MKEYISILPDSIAEGSSSSHQYLRLPHPRTGAPQLYLPYERGVCEVVKVGGARGRTWFVGDKLSQGSVLVHHPIDPMFLAIPLALSLLPSDTRSAPFQPFSDLLSTASASSAWSLKPAFAPTAEPVWNADVARLVELKPFRRAFRACCDRKLVDAALPSPPPEGDAGGDEKPKPMAYYRPSRDAILRVLKTKVDNLASEKNFNKFDHLVRALGREGLLEVAADPAIAQAARDQAAIDHVAQYLPASLIPSLVGCYDMLAYNSYQVDRAAAARAAEAPVVQEKKEKGAKRKLAKTESSRGVEALKKVNTNGMAKMTSFFKAKEKK